MKILSKYKDYYDYLSGIWGEDPKLVLDRREFEHPEFFSHHPQIIKLYICNLVIYGFWDGQNFYFGETLSKFGEIKKPSTRNWFSFHNREEQVRYVSFDFTPNVPLARTERYNINVEPTNDHMGTTISEKCPILMVRGAKTYYKFPILSKMNVGSILSPEVIYQMLVEWYSERNNEAEKRPDNQTDVQKLLSKGFDKKESFRPKIKV